MPWLKFKLRLDHDRAEQAADVFEEIGAIAVTFEDAGDQPLFAKAREQTPLWTHAWVSGLFPSGARPQTILSHVSRSLGVSEATPHESEIIADQNWQLASLAQFKPLYFGGDLWVCPSWCQPPNPGAVNITLDPGLAFGTGAHASTALCLEWLAQQSLAGAEVVDYGCGSGILAIAALKLGARHAWGIDIDLDAVQISNENAARSGVVEKYTVRPAIALPPELHADIVMANILAEPLMELAPLFTKLVKKGGHLLLAGLLIEQTKQVEACYARDFALSTRAREGWALIIATKT